MSFIQLQLQKGKEKAFNRRHPWIFSGALKKIPTDLESGTWVQVIDAKKNALGMAHFHPGSIALRVFHFDGFTSPAKIYAEKISKAWQYRVEMGYPNSQTNAFRLIFGESDGLPGLIADYYNGFVVLQAHTQGVLNDIHIISKIIEENLGSLCKGVYNKSADLFTKRGLESPVENGWISGKTKDIRIHENGCEVLIDFDEGQKTGYFLDQRDARKWVGDHSKDKKVLNAFSYTGGFSLLALRGGAKQVVSLDLSERAIEVANKNAQINNLSKNHKGVSQDIFEYIKEMPDDFDLIVLDPPAFAKRRNAVHNAVQAYKRLNSSVIKKMKPGSILCTFSCSQNVSNQLFEATIRSAAIESKRDVKIIHRFGQPSDHPINIYFPEGEYLKGIALYIGE